MNTHLLRSEFRLYFRDIAAVIFGLMLSPISMVLFWIGVVIVVAAAPVFVAMDKAGLHQTGH